MPPPEHPRLWSPSLQAANTLQAAALSTAPHTTTLQHELRNFAHREISLPPSPPTYGSSPTCRGPRVTAASLVLAITLMVIFLTVLHVCDPMTHLFSMCLVEVSPSLTLPALSLQLNVKFLTVVVHNPNPASFTFSSGGHTNLIYRGTHIEDAEIDPGRVPSHGDGKVEMALTLQVDQFAGDLGKLVADVEASTRIPDRVAIFGVFKRHVVAYSDCSFVFDVSEMGVRDQECTNRTKL